MDKSTKALPESQASMDGANAAAMQEATRSDLERGFTAVRETHAHDFPRPVMGGGFLGRSGGWDR